VVFLATAVVVAYRFVRPAPVQLLWRRSLEVFVAGLPFALAWLLLSADQRINTLLLGRLSGDASVAMFGAAARMMEATLIVPSMLATAFFPTAVRHEREGLSSLAALLTGSLKVMITTGVPIAITLAILARPIVVAVFGDAYAPAADSLRILAPAVLLLYARIGLIQIALVLGRWRLALGVQILGLAIDVVAALLLVASAGERGAAAALVLSEVVTVAAALYALHSSFGDHGVIELGRPLLAGAAAAAVGLAMSGTSNLTAIGAAGITFLVCLRIVPVFSPQESLYVQSSSSLLGSLMSFAVRGKQ